MLPTLASAPTLPSPASGGGKGGALFGTNEPIVTSPSH